MKCNIASEIKCVQESYPVAEKLAHAIQHGLEGFIVKNSIGESTGANDISHVCCVSNFKCYQRFHKTYRFKRHLSGTDNRRAKKEGNRKTFKLLLSR